MADQEKEMGLANLENFLKREFPENNKVNILLEQITKSKAELEKEMGEENPFFYGAITRYMRATASKGIDSWVDSKGNVNIAQINVVVKIAKKELEIAKEQKNKEENQSKKVLEQSEDIIKQEFKKIDYTNLKAEDLMFVAKNMKIFRESSSMEEYENVIETMNAVLGMPNQIAEWQKLAKFQSDNPDKPLDEEQKKVFESVHNELKTEDGEHFDQIKMKDLDDAVASIYKMVQLRIDNNEPVPTQSEIRSNVSGMWEDRELPLELLDKVLEVNLIKELEGKSSEEQKAIISKKIEEQNEKHRAESNLESQAEQEKIEDDVFAALEEFDQEQIKAAEDAHQKSEAQMQEENEQSMKAKFERTPDYSDQENIQTQDYTEQQEMDGLENDIFAALAEYDEEQLQETLEQEPLEQSETNGIKEQDSTLEEMPMQDDLEQEEYEAPTFEEEKTGVAKFFETIKNLRPVQAIRKVFAPREEQKKLNAPTNQRTEDGVRYTEYEQNGSLLPANIRARNFLRNISVKAVEAVTNGIKNLTERNKQEDVVLNKPEIIKSDDNERVQDLKDQELQLESINLNRQQNNDITQVIGQDSKGQAVTQGIQRRDDNPWAVSVDVNMEKAAIAKAIKTDTSKDIGINSSHNSQNRDSEDGTRG